MSIFLSLRVPCQIEPQVAINMVVNEATTPRADPESRLDSALLVGVLLRPCNPLSTAKATTRRLYRVAVAKTHLRDSLLLFIL